MAALGRLLCQTLGHARQSLATSYQSLGDVGWQALIRLLGMRASCAGAPPGALPGVAWRCLALPGVWAEHSRTWPNVAEHSQTWPNMVKHTGIPLDRCAWHSLPDLLTYLLTNLGTGEPGVPSTLRSAPPRTSNGCNVSPAFLAPPCHPLTLPDLPLPSLAPPRSCLPYLSYPPSPTHHPPPCS